VKAVLLSCLLICVPGVLTTWGEVIDGSAFTAPIHLELSLFPSPAPQNLQPAGAQHLDLARLHESVGRTSDALAEYAKATDSTDVSVRSAALAGSKKLLSRPNRFRDWIMDRLALPLIAVFNIFVAILLFFAGVKVASAIGYLVRLCRRKTRPLRLEVEPLSVWPSTEKAYAHFREIMNWTRELINEQYLLKQELQISQESTILPTIVFETTIRAWEAPLALVSDKAWPILVSLARKVNPADYILEGSLSLHQDYHIILRLLKGGTTVQIWDRSIPVGDLIKGLKDLAHAILTWIVSQGTR
jgi:hypothetical protein